MRTAQTTFTDDKGLDILFAGTGSGTVGVVVNAPNASDSFNCNGTPNPCSKNIDNTATGTITATPNAGSVFTGWSGTFGGGGTTTCTGTTSPCTFSMSNAAQSLTATFTANPAVVTPATGGAAISADTAGGTYTTLTGPVLAENGTAQIGMGTLILNAPSGFVFDTGGIAPSVSVGCLNQPLYHQWKQHQRCRNRDFRGDNFENCNYDYLYSHCADSKLSKEFPDVAEHPSAANCWKSLGDWQHHTDRDKHNHQRRQ